MIESVSFSLADELGDRLLKVEEVADFLRVNKQVVYSMLKSGEIECVRAGHQIRILRSALINYLRGGRAGGEDHAQLVRAHPTPSDLDRSGSSPVRSVVSQQEEQLV